MQLASLAALGFSAGVAVGLSVCSRRLVKAGSRGIALSRRQAVAVVRRFDAYLDRLASAG